MVIGILAAVALPQYQKAVKKARFVEWIVTSQTISKALDLWILENGYPVERVNFTGVKNPLGLDIDAVFDTCSSWYCFNKAGRYEFKCLNSEEEGPLCYIWLYTGSDEKGNSRSPWLSPANVIIARYGNGPWMFVGSVQNKSGKSDPIVCEYYLQHYGIDRMEKAGQEQCNISK